MKLLVIVLCLLSERFMVHIGSRHRFRLFSAYGNFISPRLSEKPYLSSQWVLLLLILLPWLLGVGLALHFFDNLLFGFAGFLCNLVVFYACIGPDNPFYPVRESNDPNDTDENIGLYLVQVNGQLFAPIFWYIVLGPLAVLVYRLVSLSQNQQSVKQLATWLTDMLDWLPTRFTVLLYLLVGNFQAGLRQFMQSFFMAPANNQHLLDDCGIQALGCKESEAVTMSAAESLVEHALILILVLLACFNLLA